MNFNATELLDISLKDSEKSFTVTDNIKKCKFRGDWAKLWQNICLLRQSRIKHLEQRYSDIKNGMKIFSRTGEHMKTLVSIFACILTAFIKVSFLRERLGTTLCLDLNLEIYLIFSNFLKFWVWSRSTTNHATHISGSPY